MPRQTAYGRGKGQWTLPRCWISIDLIVIGRCIINDLLRRIVFGSQHVIGEQHRLQQQDVRGCTGTLSDPATCSAEEAGTPAAPKQPPGPGRFRLQAHVHALHRPRAAHGLSHGEAHLASFLQLILFVHIERDVVSVVKFYVVLKLRTVNSLSPLSLCACLLSPLQ